MGDMADFFIDQAIMAEMNGWTDDESEYYSQEHIARSRLTAELLKQIAHNIIVALKAEGFVIQRYDAYSTSSVYLKLDYGICHSIRISDHKGKAHLLYRYNLLTNSDRYNEATTDQGGKRYFYPLKQLDRMISQIIEQRKDQINKYGERMYQVLMRNSQIQNKEKAGFWSSSKLI